MTNTVVLKVVMCSYHAIAMCHINRFGGKHSEHANSLLAMADLYLMEDFKDAVGSLIISKHTSL